MLWEIIKAIIFGLVEGVTEWLPISSTGHLILLEQFLSFDVSDGFQTMFRVVIQLGAVLAVVVIYFKKLWPFGYDKGVKIKKDIFSMWLKVAVACVPAAVVGILFDDVFDKYFYNPVVVAVMLILVGALFIVVENANKSKVPKINSISALTYNAALIIGAAQLVAAVFPGTSRSGATILAAIAIGVSREVAAEFTFFLAIPVMFGASLLKLIGFGLNFTANELIVLIVGMLTAFFVSVAAIKFLMNYIKTKDFKIFGWYRIVLGIIVLAYFAVSSLAQ